MNRQVDDERRGQRTERKRSLSVDGFRITIWADDRDENDQRTRTLAVGRPRAVVRRPTGLVGRATLLEKRVCRCAWKETSACWTRAVAHRTQRLLARPAKSLSSLRIRKNPTS